MLRYALSAAPGSPPMAQVMKHDAMTIRNMYFTALLLLSGTRVDK